MLLVDQSSEAEDLASIIVVGAGMTRFFLHTTAVAPNNADLLVTKRLLRLGYGMQGTLTAAHLHPPVSALRSETTQSSVLTGTRSHEAKLSELA